MILDAPVGGLLHVDAQFYPKHPDAWKRPAGNHEPAITHDFGPSTVSAEPRIKWPGGEQDIYGNRIPAGDYPDFHCGVDISCGSRRVPILAPADGTVFYAGILNGGSRAVVIRHAERLASGSSHLTSWVVKTGQKVKRGQKLGMMGDTGDALGIHDHFALKVDFPLSGDVNDFYLDNAGQFVNPLRFLRQFVTVHPRALDGINIRTTPGAGTTLGPKFATTDGGSITRVDGTDLGASVEPRDWGGTVTGAHYPAGGTYPAGNTWERIELDGAYRYIASPLAVLSAQ